MENLLLWSKEYGWGAILLITMLLNAGKIWERLTTVFPFLSALHKRSVDAQERERAKIAGDMNQMLLMYRSQASEEKLERQQTQEKLHTLVQSSVEMNLKIAVAMEKMNKSIGEIADDRQEQQKATIEMIVLLGQVKEGLERRGKHHARSGT